MQRASLPEHGLRIALATLASLAIAPAAAADDGLMGAADPTAMTAALVEPAVPDVPAVDPAAVVAVVAETVPVSSPAQPSEAVAAAAAEPTPALEPQPTPIGTPPPPQPADPQPAPAPDPYIASSEELAPPPSPQPEAPAEDPQYQPEQPQYQPGPEPAPEAPPPAPEPAQGEWSWDWTWDCSAGTVPAATPALPDGMPTTWNWNWDWNCGLGGAPAGNIGAQNGDQYHAGISRYHPVNINVSIRVGSPGENGPVMQTNVIVAVAAKPLVDAVEAVTAALTEPIAAMADPASASERGPPAVATPDAGSGARKPAERAPADGSSLAPTAPATTTISWAPQDATPRRAQPKPEVHRSRSSHRPPTRHPQPPLRGPVIPMGSAGAAPLGGADGGGFHLALLLVPFALALVDSARRLVRDATPPVVRERDKRRKRPG